MKATLHNLPKRLAPLAACLLLLTLASVGALAQCPMCKAAAESNLKSGGTHALGLNAGIMYLFFTPYLLVFAIGGYWWWRNKKSKAHLEEAAP